MRALAPLLSLILSTGCLANAEPAPDPVLPDGSLPAQDAAREPQADDLQNALDRIRAIEDALGSLQGAVDGATSDTVVAGLRIDALTSDVEALQQHSADADQILVATSATLTDHVAIAEPLWVDQAVSINALDARSGALSIDLDAVTAQVDGLTTQVDGVGAQVDGLTAQVDGVGAQVVGVAAQVDGVGAQVAALGSELGAVSIDVDGVSTQAAALGARMDGVVAAQDVMSALIDADEADAADRDAAIEVLDERLVEREDAVIALDQVPLDPSQPCIVSHGTVDAVYGLAVGVTPDQVLYLDTLGDDLIPIQAVFAGCGLPSPSSRVPPAVTDGSNVYLLDPALASPHPEHGPAVWKILAAL